MTFSEKVKLELSQIEIKKKCCQKAFAFGMALCGKSFSCSSVSLHTTNKIIADLYADLLVGLTNSIFTITEVGQKEKENERVLYVVEAENTDDCENILNYFDCSVRQIPAHLIQNDCCRRSFLRGCFLVCGSITDPSKEYHLEFVLPEKKTAEQLAAFLKECGLQVKATSRKGTPLLYIKESENIEDLLTYIGAIKSSLELMDIKILKDVRNKVNRVTNCETANIEKTVAASTNQVKMIHWIQEQKGLDYLSDDLKAVAKLRLDNPELSLSELCEISGLGLSRSGMNHRLKKITEIAEALNFCKDK